MVFWQTLFKNLTDEIYILFNKFKKIFNDNFYLEIQRHGDVGEKLFEKFYLVLQTNLLYP